MAKAPPKPDAVILALAARQHGVVSRAQLLRAGLSGKVIDGRLARGLLRALHRGVFQVGPIAAARAPEMAAHLACGAGSVVSHRTAAVLWQLLPPLEPAQPVEILVRGRARCRPGIVVRRAGTLRNDEVTKLDGIPATTAGRTIMDIAASVSARELEQALAQSLARRLTTRARLERMAARANGRRGSARLRKLLESDASLTRSEAEERFLQLIRRAKLPEPATNVRVAGFEVDFLWRAAGLVVEVDGYAFHGDAIAFEKDRRRDLVLTSSGLRVVRVTWKQLIHEPEALLVRLAQSLVQR